MVKDFISFYLDNGYTLTPLSGKIPTIKKWQRTEYDPFFSTTGNYGVVLGDDDVVVDIDPRNGGAIPEWLKDAQTFTVKTGGGGWHYYFKKPKDVPIVGLLKEYPGVEFKTKGQQVVGAGSVTTAPYVAGHCFTIAECSFLPLITRRAEVLKQKTDKKVEWTDDQQTQDRFIAYLLQCPVAISGINGDHTTFSVACHARDLALDELTATKLMALHYNPRCIPPWPMEELSVKINNAYKYAQNAIGVLNPKADFTEVAKIADGVSGWEYVGKTLKLKGTFRNTLNVLSLQNELTGLFRFNEFSEEIEFTRHSPWHKCAKDSIIWSDNDALMLKEWISHSHDFAPETNFIHEAVLCISKRLSYHPIRDYLQALKWDGKERIENWLPEYLGAEDSEYTRTIGKIVLCAAVSRVFKPGEKYDYLMVLEGAQRIGKSRVCEALGGAYHIGLRLDPHNKDMVAYMQSKWIIEIEEMDFATKSESKAIKAFLSRRTDRVRSAYARLTRDFPRQSIFIGTYNPLDGESQYLNDPTGNTRFWPVTLPDKKLDVERLKNDRDQLWAEAVVKAKDCKLYLQPALEASLVDLQHARAEIDPWQEIIYPWLENNIVDGKAINGVTIYTQCIGGKYEGYTKAEGRRIGSILRHLGYESCQFWDNKSQRPTKGWRRKIIAKSIDKLEFLE